MKQIQISEELFLSLYKYFFCEKDINTEQLIKNGLNDKLERSIQHDLYTKYKTAPTDEEREQARLDYLERKGIHKDFRY